MVKRVVLTGGSGFVGANLARRFLQDGHELHLLLRQNHAGWRVEGLRKEARFHTVDFSQRVLLHRLLQEIKPDWIFHLAAYGAYASQSDLQTIVQTNFNGTVNLLEASLSVGFEVFVNTGSSSEYGFIDRPATEDDRLDPISLYAVTKAASTLLCRQLAREGKANIPTLRLYTVYGPFEDPSRLIPSLINCGLQGRLPPLAGPETPRDFVYIDDVCDAFLAAATRQLKERAPVINIGTGIQTRLREVVSITRDLLHIKQEPEWGTMPQRGWDIHTWVAGVEKAHEVLGWRATTDLRSGLSRTIEWYREHLDQLAPDKSVQESPLAIAPR